MRFKRSIVIPIITYTSFTWGHTCNTNKKKLQIQQTISIRQAINAPRYKICGDMYEETQVEKVLEIMDARARKLINEVKSHPSKELGDLTDYKKEDCEKYRGTRKQIEKSVAQKEKPHQK